MKKNLIAFVLVLMMVLCVPAMADMTSYQIETNDVSMNNETGVLAVKDPETGFYVLMDADGNKLTTENFTKMSRWEMGFQVALEDGANVRGYIDSEGKLIVPMQYGDIKYLSEKWQLGIVLEPAATEEYDYKNIFGEDTYIIVTNDIYYMGQLVASLSREEVGFVTAYGDYLRIQDREGNSSFYDSAMNKSAYDGGKTSEYAYDYATGIVLHCGSNQQAFVPGCTLTSDMVEQDTYEINGVIYDLQGNILFEEGEEWSAGTSFFGDHMVISNYDLETVGVIDRSGNVILPCEYDSIEGYGYEGGMFFPYGYQFAVKDGLVGCVDMEGNVTCEFKYNEDDFDFIMGPLCRLETEDDQVIVLSGAVGEMPQKYADAKVSLFGYCPIFVAEDTDGKVGVVDLYGNVVIPFDEKYGGIYAFDFSADGSVITAKVDSVTTVYKVSTAY